MNKTDPLISIIVPLAPNEEAWKDLLSDLLPISDVIEVILASPRRQLGSTLHWAKKLGFSISVVETEIGRAHQMNSAALHARGEYLWFLHADSRLNVSTLEAATRIAQERANGLYFFDLAYQLDGPRLTRINSLGAYIRSHLFGLPFGDQGFLLSKNLFDSLGMFPEGCAYGEDHLLIWKAKRAGIRAQSAGARILTSARRYRNNGWLRTTLFHARLFISQMIPQLFLTITRRGTECENTRLQSS